MESPVNCLPHKNTVKRIQCSEKQYKPKYMENPNDFDNKHIKKCYHCYYNDFDDGHFGFQYIHPQNIRIPIKTDIPDRIMLSSRINPKACNSGLSPIRTFDPREYYQFPRMYLNSPIQSYPTKPSLVRSVPTCDNWNIESLEEGSTSAVVTTSGIISLMIHKEVRIDLTVDGAIRIVNYAADIRIAVSVTGKQCAFLHPVGRMYLRDNKIEIVGISSSGVNKFAKIWSGGISFTTEKSALVYLIDPAGTRSTKDTFSNLLDSDFSTSTFLYGSQYGTQCLDKCINVLDSAHYKMKADGSETWKINDILIQKTVDNLISVNRNKNEIQIKTNLFGKGRLTTATFHATASSGEQKHLFVKSEDKRMHYDGNKFVVRNAAQSAGFEKNQTDINLF